MFFVHEDLVIFILNMHNLQEHKIINISTRNLRCTLEAINKL